MTRLLQPVLDTADVGRSAAFYLAWLGDGWACRGGDPAPDADWAVLQGPDGARLALQLADPFDAATWPRPGVPQQAHLDFLLDSPAALEATRARLAGLDAPLLRDNGADPDEPLYVFADPDGHPFCVLAVGA
ncbi:VOC family protein [Propioniciclava coleopterorum]|uniref:VOC family protein n=1 Tax=Propioniciclava coleopterorum TaxID=2714937 RepID=A0A6G7Y9Y9_9ACTN|nr:VOC family protein [Propioniciclava coleopterorum]QIK73539.1 VOC family protein [Propioniciclava coleopterorum]